MRISFQFKAQLPFWAIHCAHALLGSMPLTWEADICKELPCDLDKAHHQRALFDVIVPLENWFTCSGHDHKECRNDESFVLAHRASIYAKEMLSELHFVFHLGHDSEPISQNAPQNRLHLCPSTFLHTVASGLQCDQVLPYKERTQKTVWRPEETHKRSDSYVQLECVLCWRWPWLREWIRLARVGRLWATWQLRL